MKEFMLTDKCILVTGANGLIGREVADALSSAGSNLMLLDVASDDSLKIYDKKDFTEKYSTKQKVIVQILRMLAK